MFAKTFDKNLLFKCESQPEIAKNSLKPLILNFKVVQGVYTPRKVASSACYDKQQVCVYLQPFS